MAEEIHVSTEDPKLVAREILNGPEMRAVMDAKAAEGIEVAKGIFLASSKGDSRPPEFYVESFGVRHTDELGLPGIEVYNDDRDAEWVEYGAHPGGGHTGVERYRVMGRTLDVLEAEGNL